LPLDRNIYKKYYVATGKHKNKVVLVLNLTLFYEDIWENGGIAPRIPNIGI
jgi:hypothetical protein